MESLYRDRRILAIVHPAGEISDCLGAMNRPTEFENLGALASLTAATWDAVRPNAFLTHLQATGAGAYLGDALIERLFDFFKRKRLAALKEEDRQEQWYDDWLAYQAKHQLYARLLSPKKYSSLGTQFDLLRLTRFLEVFGYCGPGHGYSFQVTFLGLFAILMGSNDELKREAIASLEAGGVFAFAVSEQEHGADLLGNAFMVRETRSDRYVANGNKYYIGNSNCASMISVLARKEDHAPSAKRAPFIFFALRPRLTPAFQNNRKIHTLGVRAGFVGAFEVKDHEFPKSDVICEGRAAWDAIFGTVTLGKFFLGFGSIGICQHAFEEASAHLGTRILYGKPAIEMPLLRSAVAQAYARLAAMKLYAYRALDYVHAANAADRRYMLFAAVQKAKVSTEGVKVMALLSECIGAKAFEADTYFEMALRDAQLIPSVEGSTHVNLALIARFITRYFSRFDSNLVNPESLAAKGKAADENPFLMEARTGSLNSISFPDYLLAYQPLLSIPNVRSFAQQARAFQRVIWAARAIRLPLGDAEIALILGQFVATIVYGQLIAENAERLSVPSPLVNSIFHVLVNDLSAAAMILASSPKLNMLSKVLIRRLIAIPKTSASDWEHAARCGAEMGLASETHEQTPG
jgi:acyl-CoA dehydrogenase